MHFIMFDEWRKSLKNENYDIQKVTLKGKWKQNALQTNCCLQTEIETCKYFLFELVNLFMHTHILNLLIHSKINFQLIHSSSVCNRWISRTIYAV